MHTISSPHKSRRWRTLVVFAIVVSSLWGIWCGSALAAPESAIQSAPQAQAASDTPVPAPPAVGAGGIRYFSQTGHFLRGIFLSYWQTHGGLPVLGLPLTEPLVEDGLTVQYLERARLEWHPEVSPNSNQQVLLTRLGAIVTQANGQSFTPLPAGSDTATSFFFPQTGHNLANAFLTFWEKHGGLAVFGYPISEEIHEASPENGQTYTVQYFERERFEWHPEAGAANNVQLGLLGLEYAQMLDLNPLARVLVPEPVQGADQNLTDSPTLASLVDSDLLPAIQALGNTPQFRWVPAIIVDEKIPVEFADINEPGVAGAFITTRSHSQPYAIVIPATERGEPVNALASVLAHEATHAYDTTHGVISPRVGCSVEEELRAYMNGLSAWILLQGSDALSQDYPSGSLEAGINESLRDFNDGNDQLIFNFDPAPGRQFLSQLYGSSCGG